MQAHPSSRGPRRVPYLLATVLAGILLQARAAAAPAPDRPAAAADTSGPALEEIVVTGELRESTLMRAPVSVSVIDDVEIQRRNATHLEELLNVAPNVNYASGASRARFFQIRGIGERGQYAEPLNPSVGVILDDVDLSGAATAATLFDVRQVEVFRGPQSGRYGANALAGLIVLRSNAPTDTPEAYVEAEAGDYGTRRLGAVVSGPLVDGTLSGRLAVQRHVSDGYIHDAFLSRHDTNDQDETTARARLRWTPTDRVTADLTLARIRIHNGYDAFTLDNSRTTLSDQPGRDEQDSTLGSLRVIADSGRGFDVEAIAALSDSRIDYGYDEDWTFVGFSPDGYSSTDRYLRDRRTHSLEVRLVSNDSGRLFGGTTRWLLGVYDHHRDMDLTRLYTFLAGPFDSRYRTDRTALYGQLEIDLSSSLRLITALRREWRSANYRDSDGVRFDPDEQLWGGRIGLEWQLADDLMAYATVSRGYKAGGFNTDGTLDADLRRYDPEYALNYEAGLKGRFADGRVRARLATFWMDRRDQQVSTSLVRVRGDGSSEFIAYVGNAASGTNQGMEAEFDWQATDTLTLSGSLGLLRTQFDRFVNSAGQDLSGRDQAQAPHYQFHLAADWRWPGGWFARLESEGRDAFFWSDSHDEKSKPYALYAARAGWSRGHFEVALFGRNLGDKDYGVRGFGGFGNDPRNGYAPGEYIQLGAPRTFGVSARVTL